MAAAAHKKNIGYETAWHVATCTEETCTSMSYSIAAAVHSKHGIKETQWQLLHKGSMGFETALKVTVQRKLGI
jgi:hypothetical protein